jgi:SpoVK/Ycf46/Vps4 family AAA+-type ATPase
MAASVIAGLFDLELFQIDLSRIVSKWLGETEKNLATIFDEAEKAHAILLFDEADSLFAKRTEVQSSNDRHANLEVNFLLQKMDRFQGITLLTSNFGSSIDEAFLRRLSFRIEFPAPTATERAALWARLTPTELEREDDVDFQALGQRFELSGGHIRNAIFKAAISAAEVDRAVSMRHLVDAANTEYRAIGKIVRAEPR